ncbi:MAG: ImmA/IrrE family metallo-endopeptidase [Methylobacteriaceae bacterium]|nr:ImmA/IrrE family metallo-endopeptidase [Methylobacteriaceae bacterium]
MAFEMQDHSQPIPLRVSKRTISDFAERVANQLGFRVGDTIEPFVVRLGGKIVYKTPAHLERLPESIIVRSESDFTIFLPSMTSPQRDRFTIAHELAHLILHYPLAKEQYPNLPMVATRWVDEKNQDLVRTEWEANWFAAAFLMPEMRFRELHKQVGLAAASTIFKVSQNAAKIRASSLGLN